jgi:succinoglycan biosynthesis transport protein ExoP
MNSSSDSLSPYRTPGMHPMTSDVVFDPVTSISLSSLLGILRHSLWWIVLMTAAAMVAAAMVLHSIAPHYQAQAVLQISQPTPPLLSDSPTVEKPPSDVDDLTVNSEMDAILAQPVLDKVIAQLHLDQDPEFNPSLAENDTAGVWGAIESLKQRLSAYLRPNPQVISKNDTRRVEEQLRLAASVFVKNRSRVMVIQVTSLRPEKAAAIANAIASAFLQNRLDAKLAYTKQLTSWLDGRLGELRAKVTQSEQELDTLRTSVGQYEGQTTTPLLSEQLSQIARQLIDAKAEQSQAQAKVDQLGRLAQSDVGVRASDAVLASSLIANLQEQKAQLDTQRQEEESRLGPMHPDIKSVNSQIDQIDAEIAAETARITRNAGDQLKEVSSRVATLQKSKTAIEKSIDAQGTTLVRLHEVQAQADSDRKAYESFAIYRDKLAGANEVDQPEAEMLSTARPPISPAYPRDLLTLAAVGFITMLLGVIYALVRPSLDNRLRTAQDIAAVLGLPTLASIQRISRSRTREASVAEGIRYLYTELEKPHLSGTPLKILFSSSLPREGKTTIATMLAREAATDGRSTLLIDLDIRRQLLAHLPAVTGRSLSHAQSFGTAPATFEPSFEIEPATGLTCLSFRTALQQPFKLLYTQQFWKDIAEIMARFDLVIIDSPPILSVPDAKIIAGYVDKTVFLVKWGSTKRGAAVEGVRHFRAIGAEICGAVLTQVISKKQASYHGDYLGT